MIRDLGGLKLKEFVDIKKLARIDEDRGSIVVVEGNNVPFIVKRTFIIYHNDGNRGNHANLRTKELIVCLKGYVKIFALGNGFSQEFELAEPDTAIYVPAKTWLELKDIERGSIILVLASEKYESGDYIRDFDQFNSILKNGEGD